MERAGAARLLREPDLAARLVPDVTALLDDAGALRDMAAAARAHARPNAAENPIAVIMHARCASLWPSLIRMNPAVSRIVEVPLSAALKAGRSETFMSREKR
jgi:hypothetical protein